MSDKLEKITLRDQVIYGAFATLAREMGHRLKRAAHSSLIRESDDYGAAIVSSAFELVAEAETTPLQMGPLAGYCRGVLATLEEAGQPMDGAGVYLHNDPYRGASHSPDIGAVAPLTADDGVFGYVGTAAHHVDIGAAVPGTCIIDAHDAYSEGLRLLAFAVEDERGPIDAAWRLVRDNVRMPDMVIPDLKAQVAACRWGQRGFQQLVSRYGVDALKQAVGRLLDVAERHMRARIRELPNGRYEAEGYLDGYVDTGDPADVDITIRVAVEIEDERMTVDLNGSAPQLPHAPINMPFRGTTDMAVLLTLRTLLLPETEYPNLPQNAGLFRPVRLLAPAGTIVNPVFPAPTIGRFCGGQLVANLVVRALADVLPERVCAGCSTTKAVTFSGQREGKPWIYMDVTEGAYGGMQGLDGLDAVDILYANTKNNPIEDIETHYPLRVERYELREGSAGKGKWRGGIGPVRETRLLQAGHISVEGDGFRHAPWGLYGGHDGATGGIELTFPDSGETVLLPSKIDNRPASGGTVVRDLCPSGGGYGRPEERDAELRRRDEEDEMTTP